MGLRVMGELLASPTPEGLSHKAKHLRTLLGYHANDYTRECYPSLELLAREMGCSRSTAKRALGELMEAGCVKRKRTGRSNRYELT